MAKIKGLGRGLDALLSGNNDSQPSNESLQNLKISSLQPGKYQPRTHMDENSLAELAGSIKSQGIMQPVLVRMLSAGRYEIIAGERRWRAAQLAGLQEIPVLIRDVPDESALTMSLIENIQREELNPLEEALGIQRLASEFQMTHQTIGEALGSSRSTVSNLLRLLNLSAPIQELMMQGKLDMGHGRALLGLPSGRQLEIAHQIISKQLSVRETEKLAGQSGLASPKKLQHKQSDRDLLNLQEDISVKLGAKVTIKSSKKKGAGSVVISYSSLEQLEGILVRFG
jgi:ParB family transcriptional regulator, chromosome partitioning protein